MDIQNSESQRKSSHKMFTKEEDQLLKHLYEQMKIKNWNEISSHFENRSPKNCRDRYINYLSSCFKNDEWLPDEDETLSKLIETYGKKWTIISELMHRSPNTVKNRWYRVLLKATNPELISSIEKKKTTIRVARLVFPKEEQISKISKETLETGLSVLDENFGDFDFLFSF
jgi:hypothetical protein